MPHSKFHETKLYCVLFRGYYIRVSSAVVFTWEKQCELEDSAHSLFDFADLNGLLYEPKLQVGDIDLIAIKLLHNAHHYSHIGNNTWLCERKKGNAQWEKSQ